MAVLRIQATWRMFAVRKAFLAYRKNKAATLIQSFVRMHQQQRRFRRATDLGKRQALRSAKIQQQHQAAVVIQKNVRRRLSIKKVLHYFYLLHLYLHLHTQCSLFLIRIVFIIFWTYYKITVIGLVSFIKFMLIRASLFCTSNNAAYTH